LLGSDHGDALPLVQTDPPVGGHFKTNKNGCCDEAMSPFALSLSKGLMK